MSDECIRTESVKCLHCNTVVEAEAKPMDMPSDKENGKWFKIVCLCPKCGKPIVRFLLTYFLRPKTKRQKGFNMVVEIPLESPSPLKTE